MSKHTFRSSISAPIALRRGAPRRGQALLLAVLVMVFAALIGSTFITVVALNMDQTAAQQERVAAANSARNGLDTINYQLDTNGTGWRPEHITPPPAPGDPDYNFYYTPQEIANGYARLTPHASPADPNSGDWDGDGVFDPVKDEWAKLESYRNNAPTSAVSFPVFVKFPDPRNLQVANVPTYLAEVRVANANENPDKQKMLRITIVGTSPNDPKVLVPRVAYKGTSEKGGAFAWDIFHTNWNYTKNAPVRTEWNLGGPAAPGVASFSVQDATGIEPGRSIVLQQGAANESALVTKVNGNTVYLKTPTTLGYQPGVVSVRASTTVMNDLIGNENYGTLTTQFSADGEKLDGSGAPCSEEACAPYEITATQFRPLPYGAFFNTDVEFEGKSTFSLLPTSAIKTSGLIYASATQSRPRVESGGAEYDTPTSNGATQVQSAALNPFQKLVYDNLDVNEEVSGITDPARGIQPQAPPSLDKFTRLQEMTKYTSNAALGLGDGVYINNANDVEQVVENGSLRPLTNSDLQRLWQRKSFPAIADGNADAPAATGEIPTGTSLHRLCYRRLMVRGTTNPDGYQYPVANPAASLEQNAIRGWINEQEFVPRGALIELSGNFISITLDDRSDGGTLPDSTKAWPYATANTSDRCYRMVIDTATNQRAFGAPGAEVLGPAPTTPFNGVIYAEGNIRVRGTAGAKDVTIVSMNNIYVEGNLRRQPSATVPNPNGRIALLAKKNVVLNPTQFITRVRGTQDSDIGSFEPLPLAVAATNMGMGSNNTTDVLQVSTVQPFRLGDTIKIAGSGTNHRVTEVVTAPTAGLVIAPPLTAPLASAAIIIQDVAAMVGSVTGNTVVVNAVDPFRLGDRVHFGNNPQWFRIDNINAATNTLTLNAAPTTVPDDAVELMIVPDISKAQGTPEYRYNLSGRRVFERDADMDGVPVAAGNGGYFRTLVRAAGTMRKAYQLTLEPLAKNGGAAVNTPFTNPLTVTTSDDTNANKILEPGEWHLKSVDPNGAAAPKNYGFDYDYLNVTNKMLDDSTSTPGSPKGLFNNLNQTEQYTDPGPPPVQVYKWELSLPTGPGAITAAQAQQIESRCLMAGGSALPPATTNAGNPWNPAPKAADDKWQLWLTSSGSMEWNNTPIAGLSIGSPRLATDDGDLETMQPDFYFTGQSGSEQQQWMRWLDRAAGSGINAGSNIIRLTNNNLGPIPQLRVSGVKLERDDFIPPATSARTYDAMPVLVEATVFAQEGSWFVIPMPVLNRTDVDHDDTTALTTADIATTTRMRRLNYDVQFTGRIIQNYAPTALYDYDDEDTPDATDNPNAPGSYVANPYNGAMAQWIDAMAHPTAVEPVTPMDGRGRDWQSIIYNVDPAIPVNTQLMLPPSPDITIVN